MGLIRSPPVPPSMRVSSSFIVDLGFLFPFLLPPDVDLLLPLHPRSPRLSPGSDGPTAGGVQALVLVLCLLLAGLQDLRES